MLINSCPNPTTWNWYYSSSISSKTHLPRTISNAELSSSSSSSSGGGRIKRLVLTQEGRTKLNPKSDREFYDYPRFVTHVDNNFISILTNLYRERLRPDSEILDLMSSWVSHLPHDVKFKRVVGHGLNAQELSRNPRLDYFFVKDLNEDQQLQMETCSFDAVLCTVSVQYLQQPEKVSDLLDDLERISLYFFNQKTGFNKVSLYFAIKFSGIW